jgi:tRNA A37 N6-isopentenylltransferase MiaA
VEAALEAVVRRTRAYARRQLAWFRRDPRVRWSTLPPGPRRLAWALEAFLQKAGEPGGGAPVDQED